MSSDVRGYISLSAAELLSMCIQAERRFKAWRTRESDKFVDRYANPPAPEPEKPKWWKPWAKPRDWSAFAGQVEDEIRRALAGESFSKEYPMDYPPHIEHGIEKRAFMADAGFMVREWKFVARAMLGRDLDGPVLVNGEDWRIIVEIMVAGECAEAAEVSDGLGG